MTALIMRQNSKMITFDSQQGGSSVAMIMLLSVLSLAVLLGNMAIQAVVQREAYREITYYQHYHLASSGLAWGKTLDWFLPTQDWQCQQLAQWQACIKHSQWQDKVLLKGQAHTIAIYGLGEYHAATRNVVLDKGKWLDFCPEPKEANCDE